jgi:hypothetical protein
VTLPDQEIEEDAACLVATPERYAELATTLASVLASRTLDGQQGYEDLAIGTHCLLAVVDELRRSSKIYLGRKANGYKALVVFGCLARPPWNASSDTTACWLL